MAAAPLDQPIRRVRMFAGPNGSGKSTLKQEIIPESWLGVYVNADDIEQEIKKTGALDLAPFKVQLSTERVRTYYSQAGLLKRHGLTAIAQQVKIRDGHLLISTDADVNSYHAAVTAALLREELLLAGLSFTFETVMSYRDKVDLLARARNAGYRTYLYFVATETPRINIQRVKSRVEQDGHDVPEDKIIGRYPKCLALLPAAIRNSDRAFIFDNSAPADDAATKLRHTYVAEITNGHDLEIKCEIIPAWFRRVVEQHFMEV